MAVGRIRRARRSSTSRQTLVAIRYRSAVSDEERSFRFDHVRVPLPVRESGGTFVVNAAAPGTAGVVLESTFEPLDPSGVDQLTAGVRAAFQESLDSLRGFIEEKVAWDAR